MQRVSLEIQCLLPASEQATYSCCFVLFLYMYFVYRVVLHVFAFRAILFILEV